MASSSKRRASPSKPSSAGKARVISVGRKDALPRTGDMSAGRRKPVVQSPVDASKEPLATALARSNNEAHDLQQTETSASRTKTARPAGRASGKRNKRAATEVMRTAAAMASGTAEGAVPAPAAEKRPPKMVDAPAVIAPAVEPEMVTALESVAQIVGAIEAATMVETVSAMAALAALAGEALPVVETEVEVEASAIVEERMIVEAPLAPAAHPGKRALVTVALRLLSTLCRWTGVRR